MGILIREAKLDDAEILAQIISSANKDVAEKFSLNAENAPKHPSFCTKEWVMNDFDRGEEYYILEIDGKPVGCVAYEQPDNKTAYLNRLSVIPAERHKGYGKELVDYHHNLSCQRGIKEVSIGIINKNTQLKVWYEKMGFEETLVKVFEHLPFDVCFMKKIIKQEIK